VHRQELELVPWEVLQNVIYRRAVEERGIRIGLSDQGIRLGVSCAENDRAGLVPDHEPILLGSLRDYFSDRVHVQCIDVDTRIKPEAEALRNPVGCSGWVVPVAAIGWPGEGRPSFDIHQSDAHGMGDLASLKFFSCDLA